MSSLHQDTITRITAVSDDLRTETPIGKRFELSGTTVNKTAISGSHFHAEPMVVADALDLAHLLTTLRSSQALILGSIPAADSPYWLLPRWRLNHLLGRPSDANSPGLHPMAFGLAATRTKNNFRPSGWVLLDRDIDASMPSDLSGMDATGWERAMTAVCPGLNTTIRVRTASSSNRVSCRGQSVYQSPSSHTFVRVLDPADIPRWSLAIEVRSWLSGYGYTRWSEKTLHDGQVVRVPLRRTIFDPSVFRPERIVFEGAPAVGDGLEVLPPQLELLPGVWLLDTHRTPDLTDEELQRYYELTHRRPATAGDGAGGAYQVATELSLALEIETKVGVLTVGEYYHSDYDKLRCQTPFRDSNSWAGILDRNPRSGYPQLADVGSGICYQLCETDRQHLIGEALVKFVRETTEPVFSPSLPRPPAPNMWRGC